MMNGKLHLLINKNKQIKLFLFLLLFPIIMSSQAIYKEVDVLFNEKNYKKAETLLSSYVSNNKNDVKAIELLGDAYGYQKNWDGAIMHFKTLTEVNDTNANYHYKYGGALGMKALQINKMKALTIIGDIKNAFLRAAELDPKHIETRWALVELYMQLPGIIGGSKNKSLKYANELEALSKVDGYLAKGYINEYDDEPELAEFYYKKAINMGGSVTCYDKLTALYEKEKQPKKAVENIEASIKKMDRNAMHYQIGKVCAEYNIQLNKGEQCLQHYIKNYSSKDGVPKAWAYYRLAQINKHKKDKTKALNWINMAISELPKVEVFKTERNEINQI